MQAPGRGRSAAGRPVRQGLLDVTSFRHRLDSTVLNSLQGLINSRLARERTRYRLSGRGPDALIFRNDHERDAGIGNGVAWWASTGSAVRIELTVASAKGAAFLYSSV